GTIQPDSGETNKGVNTRFGYYTQSELKAKPGQKVIDLVKEVAEVIKLDDGRTITASQMLNLFLFDKKAQYNFIERLSGGEKRRLQLLQVLMGNPNFLILDEPTNDLDIMTLNILEDYLEQFDGCLMIVSHDRYFMDRLTDHLFVFEGEGVIRDFNGNYTDYRESLKQKPVQTQQGSRSEVSKAKEKTKSVHKEKLSFKEKREMEQLESELPELEEKKAELVAQLNAGIADHEELMKISKEIEQLTEELEEKEMRWLELSEKG
ncbi:MAG: ATP-binding cassette domain-containing protein, partial [Bacteroidota bacterium]